MPLLRAKARMAPGPLRPAQRAGSCRSRGGLVSADSRFLIDVLHSDLG